MTMTQLLTKHTRKELENGTSIKNIVSMNVWVVVGFVGVQVSTIAISVMSQVVKP